MAAPRLLRTGALRRKVLADISLGTKESVRIGRWRDAYGDGRPIDPSGTLPDGKTIRGPQDLKQVLKEKKGLFARCLTEKLLTYALGRRLEFYDAATVKQIVQAVNLRPGI